MTLYELTEEYQWLLMLMEDPEADPLIVVDTLDAVGGEIEVKADGYARVLRNLEADVAGLKSEEQRLAQRRRTIENNIDRIKYTLTASMIACNKRDFKTDLFTFRVQKNPASVVIERDAAVPDEYLIPQEPKVDKVKVKEALKAGANFEWAHLYQTEGVRIR